MKRINLVMNFFKKALNANLRIAKAIHVRKNNNSGFTMVEIITVVLIIGILAVILAPSWSAFVNRQRVNKINDTILAAIQDTQRQAKQKKLSYSVSFKVESAIPKIVIHPDSEAASDIVDTPERRRWQILGENLDIKSTGQIGLLTNLSGKNAAGTSVNELSSTPQTITFDYMGTLANADFGTPPTGSDEAPGIKIVVKNNNIKRCVILKTLLGATLTEKDSKCN